ncbi:c-type cytochrome [Parasphingorhabdus sp.]|uniref:c-type cytochrome n=1 Tax=Parasphingorhabdus sp. TaxID=2709688 RepID=UPI0032637BCB
MRNILICGLVLMTAACGQQDTEEAGGSSQSFAQDITPSTADIKIAQDSMPADAAIAAKYDRSCRTCHSMVDAMAPLTKHEAAWQVRYAEKSMDDLLLSTKDGLNAMPPMGLCNDCSDAEFTALIDFMAGRSD